MVHKKIFHTIRKSINVLILMLLIGLVIAYLTDNLGPDRIRRMQHLSGDIALISLLISLSVTPFVTLSGITWLGPLRKTFGLGAFYFALLHVLIYSVLDYRLDVGQILLDFRFRQYLWFGLAAFIILAVMAVTSLDKVKKAVRRVWRKIHRFVYLAGLLVVIHYALSVKGGLIFGGKPLVALVVLVVLLVLRLPPIKKGIIGLRKKVVAQAES